VRRGALTRAETLAFVQQERPAVVCVGALAPGGLATTRYLTKRLRARFPDLPVVVGRWGAGRSLEIWRDQLSTVGAEFVVGTLEEARAAIIQILGTEQPAESALGRTSA
jgi:hypothetical protein